MTVKQKKEIKKTSDKKNEEVKSTDKAVETSIPADSIPVPIEVPAADLNEIDPNSIETKKVEIAANNKPIGNAIVWNVPRFTLIIPCYNNAGYVVRCLNSIKKQTFDLKRVQVIAVDDCSTDGSGDIFELIGNDIPDFTLIRNDKNIGVGASRNTALLHATGKYIYFIDCDDYLSEKALERIDEALKKANDPDVAFLTFQTLQNPKKEIHKPEGKDIVTAFATCPPGPWCKVFKRVLFVPFPTGFRAEDTVWHFVQIDRFNSYCNVEGDEPCYMYDRMNTSAITDTLAWSAQNALTLEHLAKENDAIKAGKNDKFFSDVLRALAEMYDSRHRITKPFVKNLWFARFCLIYKDMVCGHFHN